jgi:predicted phosphoribosyltransferase/dienelactone hydrolase
MQFINREQAGILLAERMLSLPLKNPLLLALPRGGVPIGAEISKTLGAPLDVLIVRKVGAPGYEEFGIGAITENGHYWIDPEALKRFSAHAVDIEQTLSREKEEVQRRIKLYREGRPLPEIKGRSVVVIDDGLATGVTARVACAYLKQEGAAEVILAVPVCSARTAQIVRTEVDQLICLHEPDLFFSVGQFYEDFEQLSDETVNALLRESRQEKDGTLREVNIQEGSVRLGGILSLPPNAKGLVLFAHGSGSSRFSPRNQTVARALNSSGLATLLFDLLTPEESEDRKNVFNIALLGERLLLAIRWARRQGIDLPIGLFGASTGAGAALWAAAEAGSEVEAIVSRGGRPDLAGPRLVEVTAPTLLLVGSKDEPVIQMNRKALAQLRNAKLKIITGATHLFEEPGTLEQVEKEASAWFTDHLKGRGRAVA